MAGLILFQNFWSAQKTPREMLVDGKTDLGKPFAQTQDDSISSGRWKRH